MCVCVCVCTLSKNIVWNFLDTAIGIFMPLVTAGRTTKYVCVYILSKNIVWKF
jgi:hypothetical protein